MTSKAPVVKMVGAAGLEPATLGLESRVFVGVIRGFDHSRQLSSKVYLQVNL
jgi:hypothetical protein